MASHWGWNNNNDGVFGGGTVGYNYQAGNWGFGSGAVVIGVEADFGGAGLTNNWNDGVACCTIPVFCMSRTTPTFMLM